MPDTYLEFAEYVNKHFAGFYDTKVLSNKSNYFSKTFLGNVYEKCLKDGVLKNLTQVKQSKQAQKYKETGMDCYHEAGFDAYMTGFAFIHLVKYLDKKEEQKEKQIDLTNLKEYKNKIGYSGYAASEVFWKLDHPHEQHPVSEKVIYI